MDSGTSEEKIEWKSLRHLEPQALSALHQRFYPEILRLATYRIGDPMVAEDIASEAFIRLIDALHAGKGPSKNVRGWLLGTTNNLVNDYYRNAYRNVVAPLNDRSSPLIDPIARVDTRLDSHNRLKTAITMLTDDQQMVISLRFGAEMSLAETASAMGKNANAIKGLQFRATAALRKHLEAPANE